MPVAERIAEEILQKYPQAKQFMEATLRKEAEEKIALNQQQLAKLEANIQKYNQAVESINLCLQAMGLNRELLPSIFQPRSVAAALDTQQEQPKTVVPAQSASSQPSDSSKPDEELDKLGASLDAILEDLK